MSYTCHTHVIHMSYTCRALDMHMECTRNSYEIHGMNMDMEDASATHVV